MSRKSWRDYFMAIAHTVATRSTCNRAHVGCVLVKDRRILTTGYNGSLPGEPHCDDVGHDMLGGHCRRTVHAEINAIAQAAKHGISVAGATAFVTHKPCPHCEKALLSAGIVEVEFDVNYGTASCS